MMANDKKMLYPCDPSKNKECNKRGDYFRRLADEDIK